MKSFKEYLFEEEKAPKSEPNTIHYSDIDETLFAHDHSKLRVHVKDPQGNRVRTLTNQEFNTHKLPAGHSYDFGEFQSSDVFGQSAKPIRKMLAKLKAIKKNGGKVELLTARSDLDNKDKFAQHMGKYGIDISPGNMHVRRAGNLGGKSPAENKKTVIANAIDTNGYNKVHLYDDSIDNLNAMLSLKKKYPDVEFHAHHVQHDPETGKTSITTRKV
jgi:hypothetical protein